MPTSSTITITSKDNLTIITGIDVNRSNYQLFEYKISEDAYSSYIIQEFGISIDSDEYKKDIKPPYKYGLKKNENGTVMSKSFFKIICCFSDKMPKIFIEDFLKTSQGIF